MPATADVIVVGAGAVGSAVAYYLSVARVTVLLLEREAVGSGSSAHATGSMSLLGTDFTPGASFQLGLESYRMFAELVPRLEQETGIDLLCQRRPSLRLALDEDEERRIKVSMDWQHQYLSLRWIDGNEVRKLEPRLAPGILGAAYEDESTQLDAYRLTLALARSAELHGATLHVGQATGLETVHGKVTGVRSTEGDLSCDTVVLATGAWSAFWSGWLDHPVPVRPLKGERLLLEYEGPLLPVLISSPKRGHMISRLDGLLSVGSTGSREYDQREQFLGDSYDSTPTESARLELLRGAVDVFPALSEAQVVKQLAGSRPLSADGAPIIGPVPGLEGVMLATGHGTKGVHLAPVTGKAIADWVLHGRPEVPIDMDSFLPARFAGRHINGN